MRIRPVLSSMVYLYVLVVGTLIGGLVTVVDMRGRIVDDYTGDGVVATLTYEDRGAQSAPDGTFTLEHVSRFGQVRVDARGYRRIFVPTTQSDVRLMPLALTVQVIEQGTKDKLIGRAQIRFAGRVLGVANESGNTVVSPHPGPGSSITVCAAGYEPKTVPARGVLIIVELQPGATGCPPLGTP